MRATRSSETTHAAARFGGHDEDPIAFLQRRAANALRFAAGFGLAFLVLRSVLMLALGAPGEMYARPEYVLHPVSILPVLAGWLVLGSGARSERVVVIIELLATGAAASLVVSLGMFMPLGVNPPLLVAFIVGAILIARAIYVPSPAWRTAGLGAAVAIPFVGMVLYLQHRWTPELVEAARGLFDIDPSGDLALLPISLGYWTTMVVLSATASHVVYGLRQRVREIEQLGQYHLEEKLGEGGMGIVYRARHAMLQRPTAVKLLPDDRIGELALARFEREVVQTARLTHPNTITVYDYGRTPEGVFYYAMELLDGVSLATIVEATGPMPAGRALHVLRQIAGSLAEAHALGLVHRDIKPDNVMLCEQGGAADVVKVLDFGLVKEVRQSGDAKLTGAAALLGTPQYMAPEAIVNADDVDARADLYSLGATAYYLLTGRDLFEADTVVELCGHHLHTPPTPPSARLEVPAHLDAIVLACVAKNPEDRPADGRELAVRLERCEGMGAWTQADARAWWAAKGELLDRPSGISATAPTQMAS